MTSSAACIQSDTIPASELYNPIKGSPFNPTPRCIQRRTDLSLGARAVYGYLCSCFGKDGLVHPRLETIAREAGLSSKQQASRCVSELKTAGLIAVVRTGRASYYRFLDPGAGDHAQPNQPENECQADSESSSGCSRVSEMITQKPPAPYKENNSPKKQTTPPRVVVLPDEDQVQKAFNAVPEKHRTPGVKRTLQAGIARHGIDDILKAVEYTNARSNTSYPGYLSCAVKENWAEDWTPPEVIKNRSFKDMAEDLAKIEQEQKEAEAALEHRAALAEKWLNLPEPERKEMRERYFKTCSQFETHRSRRLPDDRLALSPGFRFFLEKMETN